MTTYFITRHHGALDWAKATNIDFDIHLTHLSDDILLNAGDIIIGTLPINIVYKINQMGVRYLHLSIEIPADLRGVELSHEQLLQCNASLQEFIVTTGDAS